MTSKNTFQNIYGHHVHNRISDYTKWEKQMYEKLAAEQKATKQHCNVPKLQPLSPYSPLYSLPEGQTERETRQEGGPSFTLLYSETGQERQT